MKIEVYSPTIRRKEMDAVLTAMVEDKIGPGEQSRLLIQIAKERLGFDYCLALRSPVIALYLALKSLNLEEGQGVVISALSPRYYERVIGALKLKPVYADVMPSAVVMGRETVEAALAKKAEGAAPRAIVLRHTLGFFPDAAAIAELGLPLIEDCSQSYGTCLEREGADLSAGDSEGQKTPLSGEEDEKGAPAGGSAARVLAESSGVFVILGLEERDMLTSGGGALLYAVNRRDASVLRNLGDLPPEYGLPDMNAAMAVVQFREAAKNLEKRREIARVYTQSARRTRHRLIVQRERSDRQALEYNNYAFPLVLETGMKDVKAYAKRKDIAVESAFEDSLVGSGAVDGEMCPESYSLSLRTALFPLYPRLGGTEIEKVAKLILTLP